MKLLHSTAGIALILSAAITPLTASAVDIETARGVVTVTDHPTTLAVFDIPAVDTLHALGVPIAGTVDKLFVDYLDEVQSSATKVGSLFDPDYQALSALQPDLVIVGGRSAGTLDTVSKLAPAIDMSIDGNDLLIQTRERTLQYGELFNKSEKADELVAQLDVAVDKARSAVAGKGKALILMTNGPKISAFGPGSRFGWIYSELGLEAAVDDVAIAGHGDAVSFEFVLQYDPDWLLIIDRTAAIGQEGDSARQTLDNELIHETQAWQNKRLVYLNSADLYIAGGGIQAQIRTLNQISSAFTIAN
ncbi:putative ABC transporter solute-binding protein YclQ [Granulosicoccus antarcticus IMCC3135]|uniref:Putative ABC transporter solute-binding protein YclQ n=2 Tax=Granulosicoccus TaxID=437504 RepID=A0A2Z2NM13_9GAMM|nr:putative ABC transporter solute-binding protein YclQ [Granulosicoccus antarcticus IMCC3135]